MILVTGASGFIGKNFVVEAIKNKQKIRILARPATRLSFTKNQNGVEIVHADFYTGQNLDTALKNVRQVIHCAGLTMGRNFVEFYRANVLATVNLVSAMKRSGVKKILFLSSQSAGGPSRSSTSMDETVPAAPVSFYGLTKKMAEDVIINSELDYIILRPCSVYGPFDTEILKFIKLLNAGFYLCIGREEKLINMLYVEDLINLMHLIVKNNYFPHKSYYVTDGTCYFFDDVVRLILKSLKRERYLRVHIPKSIALLLGLFNDLVLPRKMRLAGFDKMKEMMQNCWLCSNEKIIGDTGWRPKYDLKTGMEKTLDWYRKNGYLA
ncbi:MAG: NAD(P)-dependent oxidoreductase [candidate division WOR-3 bacterium]